MKHKGIPTTSAYQHIVTTPGPTCVCHVSAEGEAGRPRAQLRVRDGRGAVGPRLRQRLVRSLVRLLAVAVAGVGVAVEAMLEAAGGRGGHTRRAVLGPGAAQPRRDVEVAEVEGPRDLGRQGGGRRLVEVGGAEALEEAAPGAGRRVLANQR